MIKDIVVNLPLRANKDRTTPFVASLAGYFGAHVTGIAFLYWPVFVCVQMGAAEERFIKEQDAAAKQAADAAVERLGFEIRREGVSWDSHQISVSADEAPGRFAEIARAFDLAVVPQAEPESGSVDDLIAQAALFQSGHPTLVVPYIQTAPFKLDRAAVLWDGSASATRAIVGAMPFLHRAQTIDLVSIVGERDLRQELGNADMRRHLSRHGLNVVPKRPQMMNDITATILNYAAESAPDLLVMGGYGHSRFREFVLGGATRGILERMTVPTLMSH
jgi:nucleotide-binding universal stress UspA family protein